MRWEYPPRDLRVRPFVGDQNCDDYAKKIFGHDRFSSCNAGVPKRNQPIPCLGEVGPGFRPSIKREHNAANLALVGAWRGEARGMARPLFEQTGKRIKPAFAGSLMAFYRKLLGGRGKVRILVALGAERLLGGRGLALCFGDG